MERFFKSLKQHKWYFVSLPTEMLQMHLDVYRIYYNHHRPHQALDGLTPAEVWDGKVCDDIQPDIWQRWVDWHEYEYGCEYLNERTKPPCSIPP